MIQAEVILTNPSGLHARPATEFVKTAGQFKNTSITIKKDNKEVNAKSVIGIMTLGAKQGAVLTICADGPEEEVALKVLTSLMAGGFGEGCGA